MKEVRAALHPGQRVEVGYNRELVPQPHLAAPVGLVSPEASVFLQARALGWRPCVPAAPPAASSGRTGRE